ncbi:Hcp family type VI secretion system effector [Scandinavium lactucae]|uniref:Hcp family type VI secretion system effector n=1 Tax=Scandinavium lactucae TaxID=3095028 RepID=A0ABU4QSJ0_9ENTR|nr:MULTISPECIES: Hcp family type VI secretion system effector [unclassified Scandinavium]MDX6041334.1 Hcp family type VI secretion system effector [Scandinavium sp. V105_6]MDX6051230.1 Hcp family type VI secretion system effector [Scandinavium sp. V105_1]
MAIPAYLWLKDDGGALIKGSIDVNNRENSIEVTSFGHSLSIPTDSSNGKLTGTRLHGAMQIEKDFDSSSPYLYKAVATGQTLESAELKWYRINDAGQEVEYFNMFLEGVKIVSVVPMMYDTKTVINVGHKEAIQLRYQRITWKYLDGNIQFSDAWNERITG